MTTHDKNAPDRGLSAEDARLDALLKAARPSRDAGREAALLDRIVATAERTPRVTGRPSMTVVETARANDPATTSPTAQVVSLSDARKASPRPRRDIVAASGLLAASLVAGLMLGQMPYAAQTVTRIEQATGMTIAAASDEVTRAITAMDMDEEDL